MNIYRHPYFTIERRLPMFCLNNFQKNILFLYSKVRSFIQLRLSLYKCKAAIYKKRFVFSAKKTLSRLNIFLTSRLSAVTVVELILILVILIALLVIFKTQLINLVNSLFDKVTSESGSI